MKRKVSLILSVILLMSLCFFGNMSAETVLELSEPKDAPDEASGALLNADVSPGDEEISIALVSSGTIVWRIRDNEIVCEDAARPETEPVRLSVMDVIRENAATLQLSTEEETKPEYITVIRGDEEYIRLCLALRDSGGEVHVILNELTAAAEGIRIRKTTDVTASMSRFFGEDSRWLEVDMAGLTNDILIYALDESYMFHIFRYNQEETENTELASLPLSVCTALIPYQESVLIAGMSVEAQNTLDLIRLSPSDGGMDLLASVNTEEYAYDAMNITISEDGSILCYTVNNVAYRVLPESGSKPVPFANMTEPPYQGRTGVIIGDQYILYGESGELIRTDINAELQAVRLMVSNMTGEESVRDVAAEYSGEQKQAFVTVSDRSDESSLLTEMLNQTDSYDFYLTEMNGTDYAALKARGYLTELAAGEAIRNGVADMPEYIRKAVTDGDRLLAVPVGAECECLTLNVDGFTKVTGLSREELPTDWTGFLELLGKTAEEGTLDGNPTYTVFENMIPAADLKETMFSWILRDCLLWLNQDASRINELPAVMTPILQALDRIDWSGLGLPEEEPEDLSWLYAEEQTPLLSLTNPEIAVMYMEPGTEYWPLSVTGGGERLVPQAVYVLWINPWSSHQTEAMEFLEYYWNHMDILTKMTLCRSMNEPVINTTYDEDVAYLEEMVPEYQAAIENASTEAEAEALRQELGEMEGFLNDYKENARWSASEQSIAEYRSLAEQMVLAVPEFWSADEEDAAVLQYLDGMISADQFVNALVTTLRMQAMED